MSGLSSLFSFTSGSSSSPASTTAPSTDGSNLTPAATSSPATTAANTAISTVNLSANPRYRAFSDALALCLEEFDRPAEWADLISALQKVSKVLTNKRFTPAMAEGITLHVIPHTVAINLAKRLAQCLNSGLPGGVHLKALEVYELVLDRLGASGLIPSLSIWSMGLFPLFQAASSRVKPILLDLIEKHYVPLGKSLLPALPGIIMALLPGMEEESGESHKKCFEILEKIRVATDNKTFMRCVWRALLTATHIRLAALNYLSSMLPKPTALIPASSSNSSTAITPASGTPSNTTATQQLQLSRFISSPPSLSIHALLATLHSRDNILTQRRVLELIGSHFPLREGNLQKDINSSPTLTSTSRSPSIQSVPPLPPAATLDAPVATTALISPSASNSSSVPLGSVLTIDEQVDLLSGALDILLLNDASLNRRMFAWILGSASQKGDSASNATAASPHALLPTQSLHFLYASFLRIFRQVMPDFEEDASSPTVPTFASNITIHMLLRPFQLLNVLLDRDEILHSPLLQLLHPLLLRFWFEVHELLSQLDHDTTSAAMMSGAASQGEGGSNKSGANAAAENKLFIKPRRGSHPHSRFRKPVSTGGSSGGSGSGNSANAVTSATDHLYAFYAQIPCASLWEYLFTQISRAQTNVSTLLDSAAASASSSSSSDEEPVPLEVDSEAIRVASHSLDFQIKLLEFACEVLPIQAPVPPTPSSAVSSVPPTPSSMGVTGNAIVTASPAPIMSPFKTPLSSVSASPDVSYFDTSLSDPTAAFMILFRSIDSFAAVRAYPYLVFALSTFLHKFLLRFMMQVQAHDDELQEQFNALSTSLVRTVMQRLQFLLRSVHPLVMNAASNFDASSLWFEAFDEGYLDESRLESMHLLFQFYHTCLSVLEEESLGINEFSLPLLPNALNRSRSNSQSRNHTPSRSVPPSATPSVPPSPVLISSKLQGRKNLSIDASSIEVLQPPPLIRCSSTSSQLHVQCLQQYHEELFRCLHATSIDESIIALAHWMSLAEAYGDVLFSGEAAGGTGTKRQLVFSFVLKKLWHLLHDSFAHVHREVGTLFYRFLQVELRLASLEASDETNHVNHSIESIAELVLLASNSTTSNDAYAKLMRLWRMMCELDSQNKSASSARIVSSLPPLPLQPWLWILLDVLSGSHQSSHAISSPQLQLLTREWLGDSLQQHLDRIFDPFFAVLLHRHTIRTVSASSDGLPVYMHIFDVRQVLYTLEQLQTVLELDNGVCMELLMRRKPSADAMRLFQLHASTAAGVTGSSNSTQTLFATDAPLWSNPRSYLHLLSVTLLKFLQSRFPASLFDNEDSIAEECSEQNRRIRCLASELLLFITSHIPVASVSIQLCTVFTPQILLALAQSTGVKHRTQQQQQQQQQQGRPSLSESSSSSLDTDPIVQYHLLRLLRVLLTECNRRVDFTEHAQSVQPAHSVLAHALFLQTIIAGIKAATLVHNEVASAPGAQPERSPGAKSQPQQRYFGDAVPDTIPPAKVTIASLSLLPASVKTLAIRTSRQQERAKPSISTTSVATLSHWVSFLLTTMPLLRQALPNFVAAIVGTMCGELQRVTSELKGIIPVSAIAAASGVVDASSARALSSRKASVAASGLGSGAHRFSSKHLPTPSPGGRGSINRKSTGSRASVSGNFPSPKSSPTASPTFTSKEAKDNPTFSGMELTENANRLASHAALAAACMTLLDGLRSVITYCLTRESASSTPATGGPFVAPNTAASTSSSNTTSDLDGIAMTEVSPASHSSPASSHPFASQTNDPVANGTTASSSEKSDSIAGSMLSSLTSVFSSNTTKNPVVKQRVVIGFEVHTIEGIYALMPAILDALLTVLALPLPHESTTASRYEQSGEKYAPASSTPSSRENSWSSSRSSLLPSSRGHWAQFHDSLHQSSQSFIEDLLTRNAPKTIHAIEVIWERALFELVQNKVQPIDLPSYLQGLNSGDELSAQCAANHLAPSHHLILRLLNSLPFNVGSPEILLGCLVPLTINAITKATPHARRMKASASALSPSLSAFASPLSNGTNVQSPSNAATDGIAGANSAPGAAAGAAQVAVVSSLSDAEFGFLHFTYSVLKYSKHTSVLPHLWLNKNSPMSSSSAPANTSVLSSNGSLSQLFTSAQMHACDHPLVFLWFISIMHTWILRSNIFHGGSSTSNNNATNQTASANANGNTSTAPSAKGATGTTSNSVTKPDLASLSEPLVLDKKLIREIQGSISSLLTSAAGLVGDNMEMMVEPCKNFLGVSLALLPPSIYFIAPRDELNDLLPPLSPWLQAVVQMNQHKSNTGTGAGQSSSKYPSWPHLQVTVPRNSAEFNHILSQAVPVATSSLLQPLDSISAHYGSSQNSVKKTSISLSLVTLRCFSNVLASFLTEAFAFTPLAPPLLQSTLTVAQVRTESEAKAVGLLQGLFPIFFPVLHQSHHPLNLPYLTPIISLLASLSIPALTFTVKSWKNSVWEYFFHSNEINPSVVMAACASAAANSSAALSSGNSTSMANLAPMNYESFQSFFSTDIVTLDQFRWIISRIISEEKHLLSSFFALDRTALNLESFATQLGGAASNLFSSKENELSQRRNNLKKLSFILHAGRKDQYSRHLSAILERIIENLKIVPPAPISSNSAATAAAALNSDNEYSLTRSILALHSQVFICLRVLLARVSSEHLTSLWPIVLMELIRIFEHSKQGLHADAQLLCQACKFIDIAIVILPAQFNLYAWMFVKDAVQEYLSSILKSPSTSALPSSSPPASPTNGLRFEPHAQHLDEHATTRSKKMAVASSNSNAVQSSNLIRPVLLQRHVSSLAELSSFHSRLSHALNESFQRPQAEPDYAFVDALLLSDFVDYPEQNPAVLSNIRQREQRQLQPPSVPSISTAINTTNDASKSSLIVNTSTSPSTAGTPGSKPTSIASATSATARKPPLHSSTSAVGVAASAVTPSNAPGLATSPSQESTNTPSRKVAATSNQSTSNSPSKGNMSTPPVRTNSAALRGAAPSADSIRPPAPFTQLSSLVQPRSIIIPIQPKTNKG